MYLSRWIADRWRNAAYGWVDHRHLWIRGPVQRVRTGQATRAPPPPATRCTRSVRSTAWAFAVALGQVFRGNKGCFLLTSPIVFTFASSNSAVRSLSTICCAE